MKTTLSKNKFNLPYPSRKELSRIRVAIVAACYNPALVNPLLQFSLNTLASEGVRQIRVFRVPGAYEVPMVVGKLGRSKKYHAILALGVVLQGKTAHADHIGMACAVNLQKISIETGVPVIHQILTPKTVRDAQARVRLRGVEAAQAAMQMIRVSQSMK